MNKVLWFLCVAFVLLGIYFLVISKNTSEVYMSERMYEISSKVPMDFGSYGLIVSAREFHRGNKIALMNKAEKVFVFQKDTAGWKLERVENKEFFEKLNPYYVDKN